MPVDEIVGYAAEAVVQGVTEEAVDRVHKRHGWKGCLFATVVTGLMIWAVIYIYTR